MLVYKDRDSKKDILGFQCDRCDYTTLTDVIPNDHGEFRYICPKCGYKMNDRPVEKEEETKMVNSYTVSNAAKRLNCSVSTINRAIRDGRFHDCYTEAGYLGKPAWMIPSEQVEYWVSNGGFLQSGKKIKEAPTKAEMDTFKKSVGKLGQTQKENTRTVFDPEVGKYVPVLDLLGDVKEEVKPVSNEFEKRAIRRVAKDKKYVKVLDRAKDIVSVRDANGKPIAGRYPWEDTARTPAEVPLGDTDGDVSMDPDSNVVNQMMLDAAQKEIDEKLKQSAYHLPDMKPAPVVRTDGGFSITIPTEIIEDMVQKQIKSELASTVSQLRTAFDLLNEELKKLEEAIA